MRGNAREKEQEMKKSERKGVRDRDLLTIFNLLLTFSTKYLSSLKKILPRGPQTLKKLPKSVSKNFSLLSDFFDRCSKI